MKKFKRLLAIAISLAMCCGMLAACGGKGDDDKKGSDDGKESGGAADTIVASCGDGLEGKFSPFFAQSADDMDVVDLISLYMLYVDRVSNPVLNGIEGETREYNGKEYTYTGPADITVTENEDGTVYYDFKLREDLKFSDGTPIDIDDFIFSLYVFLDPTYDGSTTMYSTPIQGLEAYRSGMDTLYKLLDRKSVV